MKMMLAGLYTCGLMLMAAAVADEPSSTLVVEASAQAPVARFNRELQQARHARQPWTNDYRQIARRFASQDDVHEADIITAQQRNGKAYVAVLTLIKPPRQGEQALYLLHLKQRQGQWQLEQARVAWRCHSHATFSTGRCGPPGEGNPAR